MSSSPKGKWGKKNRKLRNKDPYAENDADEMLAFEAGRPAAGARTKGRGKLLGDAVRL